MTRQFPEEFVEQIRSIPIEEVAALYFDLTKTSNMYQTKCIHPGDNQPSLTFFLQTNTFYCFGCGAGKKPKTDGSSVIDFVMWIDNCGFVEAVHKLADFKGMEIPKAKLSPEDKKKQEMLAQLIGQNRNQWEHLQNNPDALQYLYDRGIGDDEIAKWRIGYVPDDARTPHKGKIAFALMNDWGHTIGFSYRDMSKELRGKEMEGPKYVNSPKSPIFDKGRTLYGLNFVKRRIREFGYVIVGEGFGDAILGERLGLPFISVMGTSMTNNHIEILKQYTDTVILWMDGDNGGLGATTRHAKALREQGFIVKVINYMGKDPDDIFLDILDGEENPEEYVKQLVKEEAMLASQFEISRLLDKYESQVTELKIKTVREAREYLEELDGVAETAFSKSMIAKRLDVPLRDLGWGDES